MMYLFCSRFNLISPLVGEVEVILAGNYSWSRTNCCGVLILILYCLTIAFNHIVSKEVCFFNSGKKMIKVKNFYQTPIKTKMKRSIQIGLSKIFL